MKFVRYLTISLTTAGCLAGATGAPATPSPAVGATVAAGAAAAPDSALSLPGGGNGGSLGSMTVESRSQVRIDFERPKLVLDLDPLSAPGLASERTIDILERTRPDLTLPLLRTSALDRSVRTPRPWLGGFATGTLARMHQDLDGVANWRLEIIDATGAVVMERTGEGTPPVEIAWDGLRRDGTPAPCGLTYAHVFEARDKAGNTRRFVGDSFELPPYRVAGLFGPRLLVSAAQWRASFDANHGVSPLLTEAAGELNLHTDPDRHLAVIATASTRDEAESVGRDVLDSLAPLVGGGDGRLNLEIRVAAGSPPGGTVLVEPVGAP